MMKDIFIYHLHSDYSSCTTNIDSVTKIEMYVDMAKKCGMSALAFSEHGNILNWATKKSLIEAAGMKYVHAIELYMTENKDNKVRDNYHMIAIAKNWDGVKEINRMVTISNNRKDGHFYYSPRITLDEMESLSENIILTSACLGGPLNDGTDEVKQRVIEYFTKHRDRCFFEIQHHCVDEQCRYNLYLQDLSHKTGVRLIAGTDTHSLNEKLAKARVILQKSKKVYFEGEDGWDLTFKTYDELVEAYRKQGVLDEEIVKEAIANTCVVRDSVEEFALDTSPKYPKLYKDSEKAFKETVYKAVETHPYALKNHSKEELLKRVDAELEVYHKTNMEDFMLFQTYVRNWEHENGVFVGPGRGSVSGSMIAYLLGITEMDSIKFNLNFFRFANPDRQSNADIDSDYYDPDRAKTRNFLLTNDLIKSSEIAAFGTVAVRGAIDYVCKALGYSLDDARDIKKRLSINDKKEEFADDKLKKDYPDIFEYVDLIAGTIVSVGTHPAGVLCATRNIEEEIGLFTLSTTDHPVSSLDMYGLDAGWWTKLDCLGLDNVGIINETCKLAGIERINPDNIDLDDWAVWKDIRDDNSCIFQYESDFGGQLLRQLFSDETIKIIKEKMPSISYLKLFSFGNALIRPCGASIRENASAGIFNETGVEAIDRLLAPELGYCIIQEDIMKFLMKFCGYNLNMADKARKAIAKKKGTEQLLPEIRNGFIKTSKDKYHLTDSDCQRIIEPILQCILDATRYAFSWNHSDSYSFIGYACGWLRHYYPLEFIATCFNVWSDKEDKTKVVYEMAKRRGVRIFQPQFRHSRSNYYMDKEHFAIYKGIASIKYLSPDTAEYLFSLRNEKYDGFIDLLASLDSKHINSRQIEILIKLDFFKEFGNSRYLLNVYRFYEQFGESKMIGKGKFDGADVFEGIFKRHSRETAKKYVDLDMKAILKEVEEYLRVIHNSDFSIIEKIVWQQEYVGYIDFRTNEEADRTKLLLLDVRQLNSKKTGKVWAYSFETLSIGTGKKAEILVYPNVYESCRVVKNNVIKVNPRSLSVKEYNGRKSWYLNKYEQIIM